MVDSKTHHKNRVWLKVVKLFVSDTDGLTRNVRGLKSAKGERASTPFLVAPRYFLLGSMCGCTAATIWTLEDVRHVSEGNRSQDINQLKT